MAKIMVLGMSPLPFENDKKVYGTGIRTWQFVKPLVSKGHQVLLISYGIPSAYDEGFEPVLRREKGFDYLVCKPNRFTDTGFLQERYEDFDPDCIVGCSFYPSYIGAKLIYHLNNQIDKEAVPFWADLFGHVMAEAQARAFIDGDDNCLFHYWNCEYNILRTADIFSCVSSRQQYALAGELGTVGRLNRHTSGYDFSCNIPCGMPLEEYEHTKKVIRGKSGIKDDDFIVLWTGGYNTWTDIDTLFKGLCAAMKKESSIKFVSTGGEIPEQDTTTYPRFLQMIKGSEFSERFYMKGWVPGEDVPNYYLESDLGVNIDKDILEVKLGSKNRILDWMRAGLVTISSNVCELTDIIEKKKLGYTFRAGDARGLEKKLLKAYKERKKLALVAKKAKVYASKHFSFEKTTECLKAWCEKPRFAPDNNKEKKIFFEKEEALKNMENILSGLKEMVSQRDKRIKELEAIIQKGPAYRFYAYSKKLKRKIFGK